ncbi:hypothetical protein ILUMI_14990 [Ignelater luminosus]|uniref:PiggyBac transposable element-derived protein domain-containing protein n=1 Tax=Ignelater luminosus TaxID=2038154 RepID=A0A8K0CV00_IGNLU|nr:hypothetical protein ILUMI_14990 [Ignelater luminosus]
MSRRYLTQKQLEDETNAVSEDDEELEDPFHNSGLSDEDYCPTENDVEDSSQSGEKSDVPNMNSNTNDLEENNETSSNSGESNSSTGVSESDESEEEDTEATGDVLGERIVKNLASYLREKAVALCFDRFFASVKLLNQLDYPAVGTLMKSRRNVPKSSKKLNRGDSQFRVNNEDTTTEVKRTMKDGTRKDVPCPAMLQFYNANMGGVDLTDQIVGLYDFDRKSGKWWKKVTKTLFLPFIMQVAKGLVSLGRSKAAIKRRSATSLERPPKVKKRKPMFNVGNHFARPRKNTQNMF